MSSIAKICPGAPNHRQTQQLELRYRGPARAATVNWYLRSGQLEDLPWKYELQRWSKNMKKPLFAACAVTATLLVFGLSDASEAPIAVTQEDAAAGLFEVYERNRKEGVPNYVTEDLLLLSYGMTRVAVGRALERERHAPLVRELIAGLAARLGKDGRSAAAQANRDYLAVLSALMAGHGEVAAAGQVERAQAELALVLAAAGPQPSPLWGYAIDYTQFRPRGHYADDEALASYFRTVRYAGTALFAVQTSNATGVSNSEARRMAAQAVALVRIIESDPALRQAYAALLSELTWRFGPPEDLTNAAVLAVEEAPARSFATRLVQFAREHALQPRIAGGIVDAAKLERGLSIADALTGWRLLPQRRTPASEAFQALVFPGTGEYQLSERKAAIENNAGKPVRPERPATVTLVDGQMVKGYPLLAELFCAFQDQLACLSLLWSGEIHFEGYADAFTRARAALFSAEGLAARHRRLFLVALGEFRDFQLTREEQQQQRSETMRAFWTWQRYAALLYAKQSYTPAGKSLAADPPRTPGAAIEPSLPLYMALAHVVEGHRLFAPHPSWDRFAALLDRVIELATLHEQTELAADDEAFLDNLDLNLKALAGGADAPIVVDVHTMPSRGEALYEATGLARVVHESGGVARGARLSHCEFTGPMAPRLSDAEWRTAQAERAEAAEAMGGGWLRVPRGLLCEWRGTTAADSAWAADVAATEGR